MITPELWAAREHEYRFEVAKMQMQLLEYRKALIAAGIDPPDKSGEDLEKLWNSCRNVVMAASELVATLGTSSEMLSDRWRK